VEVQSPLQNKYLHHQILNSTLKPRKGGGSGDVGDTLRSTVNYAVQVLSYSRVAAFGANYEERVRNIIMMQSDEFSRGRDSKVELTDA
jgi:hypothetical protein